MGNRAQGFYSCRALPTIFRKILNISGWRVGGSGFRTWDLGSGLDRESRSLQNLRGATPIMEKKMED